MHLDTTSVAANLSDQAFRGEFTRKIVHAGDAPTRSREALDKPVGYGVTPDSAHDRDLGCRALHRNGNVGRDCVYQVHFVSFQTPCRFLLRLPIAFQIANFEDVVLAFCKPQLLEAIFKSVERRVVGTS
jgi:hypothetical protein